MTDLFDDLPPPCPACNQKQSTPLIFGIPSQEMLVAERLGISSLPVSPMTPKSDGCVATEAAVSASSF